jgi:hypothetical protein
MTRFARCILIRSTRNEALSEGLAHLGPSRIKRRRPTHCAPYDLGGKTVCGLADLKSHGRLLVGLNRFELEVARPVLFEGINRRGWARRFHCVRNIDSTYRIYRHWRAQSSV